MASLTSPLPLPRPTLPSYLQATYLARIEDAKATGANFLEALMVETVTITRLSGEPITDPVTFEVTPRFDVIAKGVRARISERSLSGFYESRPFVAGHYVSVDTIKITVPNGTPVEVGDLLEITESPNPDQIGRRVRVQNIQSHSQTTGLALSGEEVTYGR